MALELVLFGFSFLPGLQLISLDVAGEERCPIATPPDISVKQNNRTVGEGAGVVIEMGLSVKLGELLVLGAGGVNKNSTDLSMTKDSPSCFVCVVKGDRQEEACLQVGTVKGGAICIRLSLVLVWKTRVEEFGLGAERAG